MLFILTTCKTTVEARRIATMLLRLRLVACAKWWPVASSYWWTPLEKSRPVVAEAVPLAPSETEFLSGSAGRSLTGWKHRLVRAKEVVLLCEGRKKQWKKIEGVIRRLHCDEIPCIVAWDASRIHSPYHRWIHDVIGG